MRHMATAFSLRKFSSAPRLARARQVAEGLPASAIRELVRDTNSTIADVSRAVGPRRTIDRRLKDGSRLSPEESDRLARLLEILDLATEIFGDRKKAMAWLEAPKHAFDGAIPLDLIRSHTGSKAVEEHLLRAKYGFFA